MADRMLEDMADKSQSRLPPETMKKARDDDYIAQRKLREEELQRSERLFHYQVY